MNKDTSSWIRGQESSRQAEILSDLCYQFVQPLLRRLHEKLDRRLVQTLLDLMMVIVMHRHRNHGLLLSELGGYLLGEEHAPAGTKRISNLIKSKHWGQREIESYLWEQGDQAVEQRLSPQEEVYVIWDESVLEKPESLKAERLCAVRSSKSRRLMRIKPGYYNPPIGRPVFVPGLNWLQIVVTGLKGAPALAHIRFWTTRGEAKTTKRDEEFLLLRDLAKRWGRLVIHLWDRGFAGAPWLGFAILFKVRFIVRWQKNYKLIAPDGRELKAWECSRGKRSMGYRMIYDARRRCERKTGIVFLPVRIPNFPDFPLTLVVSRPGKGRKPWYLITQEQVSSVDDAWRIVLAYNRRWQVEVSIRYSKSELAFESPRLLSWRRRAKLLAIAALVQAFLFSLLDDRFLPLRDWLLDHWCHRTGKRNRFTAAPLYRLRLALSQLWLTFRPFSLPRLN
ncbi:MAG TPA: transposase [Anaerolineales bacterium]|nr:transposase [Anaerolineales bacterium]